MISVFDLFKIGIGPSSSHTVGPMVAARGFRALLSRTTVRLRVELFGSLAWTGTGHGTDRAICLGLLDLQPSTVDPDAVGSLVARLAQTKTLSIVGVGKVKFDPAVDLVFNRTELLPEHSNGMRFRGYAKDGSLALEHICYSIGGGFVSVAGNTTAPTSIAVPYPFATAAEMLRICERTGLSIAGLQRANEEALRPRAQVDSGLDEIRNAMFECIDRGLRTDGRLPGNLDVRRRAKALHDKLLAPLATAAGGIPTKSWIGSRRSPWP